MLGKDYAGTLGCRRLGPLPLLQGSDVQTCYEPSAAPLPRATGSTADARGGALPTLGQGHPPVTPWVARSSGCWRDQPAWPARCTRAPPGEDEPPDCTADAPILPTSDSRNICDAIGTTSLCSSTVRTSRPPTIPPNNDIRIAVVNRKTCGGGNRTAKGAQAQSILMSVLQSCRHKGIPRARHRHVNPRCSRQHPLGQPRAVSRQLLWV